MLHLNIKYKLFYITYKDCRKKPSFGGKCPICKNQICLFCSYNLEDEHDRENCCLKRSINKAIFYNGLRYILEIDKNEYSYEENIVVCEFTPGLSFFFFLVKYFVFYIQM